MKIRKKLILKIKHESKMAVDLQINPNDQINLTATATNPPTQHHVGHFLPLKLIWTSTSGFNRGCSALLRIWSFLRDVHSKTLTKIRPDCANSTEK